MSRTEPMSGCPIVDSVASATASESRDSEEGERGGCRHLSDERAGDAGRVSAAENEIDFH